MKRKTLDFFLPTATGDLVTYKHVNQARQYDSTEAERIWGEKVNQALSRFNLQAFREGQREIIMSIVGGHDTLVLMPTGGGKSLCFQVPAVILPGVTIVVSPLIALMQNQVDSLKRNKIPCATYNSQSADREAILHDLDSASPKMKLVYVAPEMLETPNFTALLKRMHARKTISLLVVDEAHCISMWGHEFRPAFLKIGTTRALLPGLPTAAFTATATEKVRVDIVQQLKLDAPAIFIRGFNRKNISYEVRFKHLLPKGCLDDIRTFALSRSNETGIIYCLKKDSCDTLATQLSSAGVKATAYHAGLSASVRKERQAMWESGQIKVVVATVAFGMGIDKADVRYVLHEFVPKSIEAFYQESGRAGRDGQPSVSVLYFDKADIELHIYNIRNKDTSATPPEKEASSPSLAAKTPERTQLELDQVEKVQQYSLLESCRRKYLLKHFGDPEVQKNPNLCNKTCDVCKDPKLVSLNLKALITPTSSSGARFGGRGGAFMSKNGAYEELDEDEIPEKFKNDAGYVPYNKSAKIEQGVSIPEPPLSGYSSRDMGAFRFGGRSSGSAPPAAAAVGGLGGFVASSSSSSNGGGGSSSSGSAMMFPAGVSAFSSASALRERQREVEKHKASETFLKGNASDPMIKVIKDAQNLAQIKDMSLPARLSFFENLRKGFVENLKSMTAEEATRIAAQVEYQIFSTSTVKAVYRNAMAMKLSTIKALTKEGKEYRDE